MVQLLAPQPFCKFLGHKPYVASHGRLDWLRFVRLAILVLLALVPPAEATVCGDWWQAEAAPNQVVFEIGIRYADADAEDDRRSIDGEVGNGDGVLTPSEARAFEKKWSWDGGTLTNACSNTFNFFALDDTRPVAMVRVEKHMIDLEGPARQDPMWYRMRLLMAYPVDGDESHVSAVVPSYNAFRQAFGCASGMHTDWWGDHTCGSRADDAVPGPRHYAFLPAARAEMIVDSVAPKGYQDYWDGRGLFTRDAAGMNEFQTGRVTYVVREAPSMQGEVVAWTTLTIGLSLAGLAVVVWHRFRVPLLGSLYGLRLFTRIERKDAQEHPRRQAILTAVEAVPGIAFNELGRVTEIPKGALAHHIRTLERLGLIVSRRHGVWTRFYMAGAVPTKGFPATSRQDQILGALGGEPGLSAAELASRIGLERRAAQYHLDRLVANGLLRFGHVRGRKRYFTVDTPPVSGSPG